MRFRKKYTHVIDAIFPIAVFFVFAASSLAVLMLSARIYQNAVLSSENHYTTRTSSAYIMEKIRQNDTAGGISIKTVDGTDCLALKRGTSKDDQTDDARTDETAYTTYIYAYNGMLKELRIRDDVEASLASGSDIVAVSSFDIRSLRDNLYQITISEKDGVPMTVTVSERSSS